jgi:hypothetical protein
MTGFVQNLDQARKNISEFYLSNHSPKIPEPQPPPPKKKKSKNCFYMSVPHLLLVKYNIHETDIIQLNIQSDPQNYNI